MDIHETTALKKKLLSPHLGFVNAMLYKSIGSRWQAMWEHILDSITLDRKPMALDQIHKTNAWLLLKKKRFPNQANCTRHISKESPKEQELVPLSGTTDFHNNVISTTVETTTIYHQYATPSENSASRDPRIRAAAENYMQPVEDHKPHTNALEERKSVPKSEQRVFEARERRNEDKNFSYRKRSRSPRKRRSRSPRRKRSRFTHDQRSRSRSRKRYSRSRSPKARSPEHYNVVSRSKYRSRSKSQYRQDPRAREFSISPPPASKFEKYSLHASSSHENNRFDQNDFSRDRNSPANHFNHSKSPPAASRRDDRSFHDNRSHSPKDRVYKEHEQSYRQRNQSSHHEEASYRQEYYNRASQEVLPRAVQNFKRTPQRQDARYEERPAPSYTVTQRSLSVHQRLGSVNDRNNLHSFDQRQFGGHKATAGPTATVTSFKQRSINSHHSFVQEGDNGVAETEQPIEDKYVHPRFVEPIPFRKASNEQIKKTHAPDSSDVSVMEKVRSLTENELEKPEDIIKSLEKVLGHDNLMKIKLLLKDAPEQSDEPKQSEEPKKIQPSKKLEKKAVPEPKASVKPAPSKAMPLKKDAQTIKKTLVENKPLVKRDSNTIKKTKAEDKPVKIDSLIAKKSTSNKDRTRPNVKKAKSIRRIVSSRESSEEPLSQLVSSKTLQKKVTSKRIEMDRRSRETSEERPLKVASSNIVQKKTKPKQNELDKLHTAINEMYDKEGIAHLSGPRRCTLLQKGRENETNESQIIDKRLIEKHQLKPCEVVLTRIRIERGVTRVQINEIFVARNPQLEEVLAPYLNKANDEATRDDFKEKTQNIEPSKELQKNRKRAGAWSRGILSKKRHRPRQLIRSDNEWEDIIESKPKAKRDHVRLKMKQIMDFIGSFDVHKKLKTSVEETDNKKTSPAIEESTKLEQQPKLKFILHPGDKLSVKKESLSQESSAKTISLPTPGATDKLVGKVIPNITRQLISNRPSSIISKLFTNINSTAKSPTIVGEATISSKVVAKQSIAAANSRTNQNLVVINDILRPWITFGIKKKSADAQVKMIEDYSCLAALYKCMGSSCSFFTSNRHLFRQHIELHKSANSIDCDHYFLHCAYCSYSSATSDQLIIHINAQHGYDRFQCSYCFYRAYNDFHVFVQHHNKYHNLFVKKLIVCEDAFIRTTPTNTIRESIVKNVPALKCGLCKDGKKFFIFKIYSDHLEDHEQVLSSKCKKCNEVTDKKTIIDHFTNCHGYGLNQCLYCTFGTNNLENIDNHLAEKHSSQRAIFCVRSLPATGFEKLDVSSSESMTITEVKKQLLSCTRVKVNKSKLVNEAQVGNLGDKIVNVTNQEATTDVKPLQFTFINGKLTTSAAHGLQILNVVSLSDTQQSTFRKDLPTIDILDSD